MGARRLSRRQEWRIRKIQEERLARLEKKTADAEALARHGNLGPPKEGLVISNHGANLRIEDEAGARLHAVPRQNMALPVAGDRVLWHSAGEGKGVVAAVLPRHSLLGRPDAQGKLRPLAANVDQVLVVVAPEPVLQETLIDHYLAAAELLHINAALVVNKADTLDSREHAALDQQIQLYRDLDYPLAFTSTKTASGLDPLYRLLQHRASVMVGQSGVGKSSLIRRLVQDPEIRVGSLRRGHGRHTTSVTTLYHLPAGGDLIDSPGVRDFQLWRVTAQELGQGFRELYPLLQRCRFRNCRHRDEPACAVREAVADGRIDRRRLESYQAIREQMERSVGYNPT